MVCLDICFSYLSFMVCMPGFVNSQYEYWRIFLDLQIKLHFVHLIILFLGYICGQRRFNSTRRCMKHKLIRPYIPFAVHHIWNQCRTCMNFPPVNVILFDFCFSWTLLSLRQKYWLKQVQHLSWAHKVAIFYSELLCTNKHLFKDCSRPKITRFHIFVHCLKSFWWNPPFWSFCMIPLCDLWQFNWQIIIYYTSWSCSSFVISLIDSKTL
jgi:hypothetical protein